MPWVLSDIAMCGWYCSGLFGNPGLRYGRKVIRAFNTGNCPSVEPELGRANSCENGGVEGYGPVDWKPGLDVDSENRD